MVAISKMNLSTHWRLSMDAAHIHLILNHIPVLGAIATLGLVVLADFKKDQTLMKLSLQVMILIAVFAIPVYLSGEPAEEIVEHLPGVAESFIETHEDTAKFALVITGLLGLMGLWGLYSVRKNSAIDKKLLRGIQVVAVVNLAVMLITANLGGQIRHTEIRKANALSQPAGDSNSSESEDDD
jgi:hypothetical protein